MVNYLRSLNAKAKVVMITIRRLFFRDNLVFPRFQSDRSMMCYPLSRVILQELSRVV